MTAEVETARWFDALLEAGAEPKQGANWVVAEMCDRVAVMYAGRVVESAPVVDLFKHPKHPYTQGLLNSLPVMNRQRLEPIEGHPPALADIPVGCAFEPRCRFRMDVCVTAFPAITEVSALHQVRCYLHQPVAAAAAHSAD